MKMKFLCAHHHRCRWLETNPTAALSPCLNAYQQGMDLAEEDDFARAASQPRTALAQIKI